MNNINEKNVDEVLSQLLVIVKLKLFDGPIRTLWKFITWMAM